MKIIVTGCAGFIGSHTTETLLKNGHSVLGIDNMNDYYDVKKKVKNIEILEKYENFNWINDDIRTTTIIKDFGSNTDKICHLASMAGVRYSIQHPKLYVDVNINGFINILEQARKVGIKQIVYASSSSVYGLNKKIPFNENDEILTPNSPYACSKLAMELYAKTYSQLYNLNTIGLRFFTVYGPRGRPDMAPYKFIKSIHEGKSFEKYGDGSSSRDYTYVDDIVSRIIASIENKKNVKCEIYNLGNNSPITLNNFINVCEKITNKKAIYKQINNQLGDVPHTYADISKAQKDLNYMPKIKLEEGLKKTYNDLKTTF